MISSTHKVLQYWFGAWPYDEEIAKQNMDFWFTSSTQIDEEIKTKFQTYVEQALNDEYPLETTEDKLACILLLDQFTRNIYRGTAKAFSGDNQALEITLELLNKHVELPLYAAVFAYMPLQHSERSDIQLTSIDAYETLVARFGSEAENFLAFAHKHKTIIDQFSRYPHRNLALGRTTTTEEMNFLEGGGARFGQ